MSQEQSEQNRSEQPTAFKLKKSRERGVVARGTDLGYFTGLAAFLVYVWLLGDAAVARIVRSAETALVAAPHLLDSPRGVIEVTGGILLSATRPLVFMVGAIFLVVMVFELVQVGGFVFTATPLKPDFSRLNPATGFKRVFSVRMLIETAKTLLKVAVYGAIAILMVVEARSTLAMAVTDAAGLARSMSQAGLRLLGFFVLAALGFAILDQVLARRDFLKRMRMSRREVKREHRDREGDPRLKQRRKELHKDFAKVSQSLRGVRGADVLVTNPTHLAVALRYDPAVMEAPQVAARGASQLALRLKRLAFVYGVATVENRPLAQALHRLEIGQSVPEALFEPVADIYRSLPHKGAPVQRKSADV